MSYESYNYGGLDQFFGDINSFGEFNGFSGSRIGGFGYFGKGKGAPAPVPAAPPPPPPVDAMSIEAIRMRPVPKDPSLYRQDPRCAKGEITAMVPCEGSDCDPGEMEPDCIDDPIYIKMMSQQTSSSGFVPMSAEELEMFQTGKVKPLPKKAAAKRVAKRPPSKKIAVGPVAPVQDVESAMDRVRAMIEAKRARLGGYNPNPYFNDWHLF